MADLLLLPRLQARLSGVMRMICVRLLLDLHGIESDHDSPSSSVPVPRSLSTLCVLSCGRGGTGHVIEEAHLAEEFPPGREASVLKDFRFLAMAALSSFDPCHDLRCSAAHTW